MKSGYRIMWLMVMFDLPVTTAKQRKKANKFRNFLLDEGFEMSQFSVYVRCCGNREKTKRYVRILQENSPSNGDISILFFTDKQFSKIININKRTQNKVMQKNDQYILFSDLDS